MATAPQHLTSLASLNRDVANWVDEVARLTTPDRIYWCDGSASEFQMLERELVAQKELLPLDQREFPGPVGIPPHAGALCAERAVPCEHQGRGVEGEKCREQQTVVDQRRKATSESGAGPADHGPGAGAGLRTGAAALPAAFDSFATSSCSSGRKMAS